MRLLNFNDTSVYFETLNSTGIATRSVASVDLFVHTSASANDQPAPDASAVLLSAGGRLSAVQPMSCADVTAFDGLIVCSGRNLTSHGVPADATSAADGDIEHRLIAHLRSPNVEIWQESPFTVVMKDSVETVSPPVVGAAPHAAYRFGFQDAVHTTALLNALRTAGWTVLCAHLKCRRLLDTTAKSRTDFDSDNACDSENAPSRSVKIADKSVSSTAPGSHLASMEPLAISQYFQYYGKMANQMNMLQDSVRTSAYRDAINKNSADFYGKTVMDVGAGSGILSFFAAGAGAQRVYAVEASSMSQVAEALAVSNENLGTIQPNVVKVLKTTVEGLKLISRDDTPSSVAEYSTQDTVSINEQVDVLISEPVGTFLFNERMLESFLYARDKFLKPGGAIYPDVTCLYIAPFSDASLYADMSSRHGFWQNQSFYGLNLSAVADRAIDEVFAQPVVDFINPAVLVAPAHVETFDFRTMDKDSLNHILIPFRFQVTSPSVVHGIAGWFDIIFRGIQETVTLSTSPFSPATHWYQIRFLFRQPLAINPAQVLTGHLELTGNKQQSYYVWVTAEIAGTDMKTSSVTIDLKDPDYRYYSNPQYSYYPPGAAQSSTAAASPTQPSWGVQ